MFGVEEKVVTIAGKDYTLRALTVGELEGAVAEHADGGHALDAAMLRACCPELADITAEDVEAMPFKAYRALSAAMTELNGLGEPGGN